MKLSIALVAALGVLGFACGSDNLRGDGDELVLATATDTPCGKYAGSANPDGTPQGFAWYKVLSCSTNTALVILQPPTTDTYWWVVDYTRNAAVSTSASSTCYPPSSFSVQNMGACPACSGSWVQRSFSCTTATTSKACSSVG
jgi:hypothetical protein